MIKVETKVTSRVRENLSRAAWVKESTRAMEELLNRLDKNPLEGDVVLTISLKKWKRNI